MGETVAAQRLSRSTSPMGGGKNLFLDRPQNRRMSKDYERLTETSEAFIYVAMSRLMVKRLARS